MQQVHSRIAHTPTIYNTQIYKKDLNKTYALQQRVAHTLNIHSNYALHNIESTGNASCAYRPNIEYTRNSIKPFQAIQWANHLLLFVI